MWVKSEINKLIPNWERGAGLDNGIVIENISLNNVKLLREKLSKHLELDFSLYDNIKKTYVNLDGSERMWNKKYAKGGEISKAWDEMYKDHAIPKDEMDDTEENWDVREQMEDILADNDNNKEAAWEELYNMKESGMDESEEDYFFWEKMDGYYKKGGEVKKKGNEMIIGGLAGILFGFLLNK